MTAPPSPVFRDLASNFLQHACQTFAQRSMTTGEFTPMVIPWLSAGPGALMVFEPQGRTEGDAARAACVEIEAHASEWLGYLLARRLVDTNDRAVAGAIVVEGWRGVDEWVHLRSPFRFADVGVYFLGDASSLEMPPPQRLRMPKRGATLDAMRTALVDLFDRAQAALEPPMNTDWRTRLLDVPLPSEPVIVTDELASWFEAKQARLEKLLAMKAPALFLEEDFRQIVERLRAAAG